VIRNSTIVLLIVVVAFAGTVGAASRPTPVPTPPTPPSAIQSPGQAMIEQEEAALQGRGYTYDPAGRRDPFRSLLVRPEDRALGARPAGIAGMSIDEVVIYGIWKTRNGYVAQVRATDNKSYLVRQGDLLYDGEVVRVGPNEVVFRQNINDPQSVKPFREVTKQLHVISSP
jgi:Tfp pilus assembly protein PilP